MVRDSEWLFKSLFSSWTEIYPKNNYRLIILHNITAKPNNNFKGQSLDTRLTNSCSCFDSDDIFQQQPRHKSHAQSLALLPIRLPTFISHAIVWPIDFSQAYTLWYFFRPWIKYPTLLLSQEGRQQNSLFATNVDSITGIKWCSISEKQIRSHFLIMIQKSKLTLTQNKHFTHYGPEIIRPQHLLVTAIIDVKDPLPSFFEAADSDKWLVLRSQN